MLIIRHELQHTFAGACNKKEAEKEAGWKLWSLKMNLREREIDSEDDLRRRSLAKTAVLISAPGKIERVRCPQSGWSQQPRRRCP